MLLHFANTVFLVSYFQISPSKGSFGDSCLWNCLCWEVYNSYTTCTEAKLAKCLTGSAFCLSTENFEIFFFHISLMVHSVFMFDGAFTFLFSIVTDRYGLWIATHINRVRLESIVFFSYYIVHIFYPNVESF